MRYESGKHKNENDNGKKKKKEHDIISFLCDISAGQQQEQ